MKVIGYVRVSQVGKREGDSFLSPMLQREKIEAYVKSKGWKLVDVVEDMDQSGGTIDRPGFQSVLSRIEAGEAQGIVTAKLDRFARTVSGAWKAIDRLRAVGGTFASVDDSFDLTTATGELMFNVLASFAQFELRRRTDDWLATHASIAGEGFHIHLPFGYVRDGRKLVPDPVTGAYVIGMFQRAFRGEQPSMIARWLTDEGITTLRGYPWRGDSVKVILRNRVYLGEARYAGDKVQHITPGAHPALVEPGIFHAVQQRLGTNPSRPDTVNQGLLIGIVRCRTCRYKMGYKGATKVKGASYYCQFKDCPEKIQVAATALEAFVWQWLEAEVARERAAIVPVGGKQVNAADLQDALATAEANLRVFRARKKDIIALQGMDDYMEDLADLSGDVVRRQDALAEATAGEHGPLPTPRAMRDMPIDRQRSIFQNAIDCVFLRGRPGRGVRVPIDARVHICGRGQGPASEDLPRRGQNGARYIVRPFVFPGEPVDNAGQVA